MKTATRNAGERASALSHVPTTPASSCYTTLIIRKERKALKTLHLLLYETLTSVCAACSWAARCFNSVPTAEDACFSAGKMQPAQRDSALTSCTPTHTKSELRLRLKVKPAKQVIKH